MAGISSKALVFGDPGNKYKFGDKELQNKEFSDGSGLETYDFDARMYDPQIGRMWQVDPWVERYERQSPFVAFNNNPIYYADPTGKGGIASVAYDKDGNPYIVVTSTIYVYNDNMSEADRKKYAAKIQSDIMAQWNNPQATDENGNPVSGPADELLGTIGKTGVKVEFNVNVVAVAESELEGLMSGEFDASKNFARLVDGGGSNFDGGYYGQFDINQLNERGSTTAAHEYGHMLGYHVDKGADPQSGPNFAKYDNESHAWKDDPKERYYIMSRSGALNTNEEISKRRVADVEYSRLNNGGGVRLPTHNSKVEIVNPNKPRQYSSTGTVGK